MEFGWLAVSLLMLMLMLVRVNGTNSSHYQTPIKHSASQCTQSKSNMTTLFKMKSEFFWLAALLRADSDRKLPNSLLPVAVNPKQSHKLKKFSSSLISKIMKHTRVFASVDCRHNWLALGALWSVWLEFGSGYCWSRWFTLALTLASASKL